MRYGYCTVVLLYRTMRAAVPYGACCCTACASAFPTSTGAKRVGAKTVMRTVDSLIVEHERALRELVGKVESGSISTSPWVGRSDASRCFRTGIFCSRFGTSALSGRYPDHKICMPRYIRRWHVCDESFTVRTFPTPVFHDKYYTPRIT